MAAEEKLQDLYVEVRAKTDKINNDLDQLRAQINKRAQIIQDNFQKTKLRFNDTLARKSITDLQALQKKLKAQFETRIKLNVDAQSLNQTRTQLNAVNAALDGVVQNTKKTGFSFKENWTKILGAIGAVTGAIYLFKKGLDLATKAANLEVLRANFQGTAEDLEIFRKATARTVSEANLIKLSNQATDLGVSLKQQALLFSLAEDAADKYGGGVEEGMLKVITASEGNIRGLKFLGIQKEVYEQIVKDLAKAHGDEIDNLDAETQKQIRLQAIIQASGVTLDDVNNKIQDGADRFAAFNVKLEEAATKFGKLVIPVFNDILTLIEQSIDGWGALVESMKKSPFSAEFWLGKKLANSWMSGLSKEMKAEIEAYSKITTFDIFIPPKPKLPVTGIVSGSKKDLENQIAALEKAQDKLVTTDKKYIENEREIFRLKKLITAEAERLTDAENRREQFVNIQISKIQAELEMTELLNKAKLGVLQTSIANLDTLLKSAKTEDDTLKILREKNKLKNEEKQIQNDINAGLFNRLSGKTGDQVFDELTAPKTKTRGEAIKIQGERIPAQLEAERLIQDLRIQNINNEFDKREAEINAEAEHLLEVYSEFEGERLGLTKEFAEARFSIEQAKIIELQRLEVERMRAAISTAHNIGSTLISTFNIAGNTLLSKLNDALQIVIQIDGILQGLGLLGGLFSLFTGGPALASAALAKGGSVVNRGGNVSFTPYNQIPKFASGKNSFRVPPGYSNDSFPIRVQSGEEVTVKPAGAAGGSTEKLLMQLINSVKANTMTLATKQMGGGLVQVTLDGKVIAQTVLKETTKMLRAGVNTDEF